MVTYFLQNVIFLRFLDKEPLDCISFHPFLTRHYAVFVKTELEIWQKRGTKSTNQLTGRLFGLMHLVLNQSSLYHLGNFCFRPKLLVSSSTLNCRLKCLFIYIVKLLWFCFLCRLYTCIYIFSNLLVNICECIHVKLA